MDVPQILYAVDFQAVRLVNEQRLGFALKRLDNQFLAAVAGMPGHVGVFAPNLKKQALQETGLAPVLPDADIRAAALEVIAIRRHTLSAPGLPVGKHKTGKPPVRAGNFIHSRVKAAHGLGFNDRFPHRDSSILLCYPGGVPGIDSFQALIPSLAITLIFRCLLVGFHPCGISRNKRRPLLKLDLEQIGVAFL